MGVTTRRQLPSRVFSAVGLVLALAAALGLYAAGAPGAFALFVVGVPSAVGGLAYWFWESGRVAMRAGVIALGVVLVAVVVVVESNRATHRGSSFGGPAPAGFR